MHDPLSGSEFADSHFLKLLVALPRYFFFARLEKSVLRAEDLDEELVQIGFLERFWQEVCGSRICGFLYFGYRAKSSHHHDRHARFMLDCKFQELNAIAIGHADV